MSVNKNVSVPVGSSGIDRLLHGPARLDEAGFVGEDDGLDAVSEVELAEDAGDVGFDGCFADEQGCGDLVVGLAFGDQLEHLELAVGQLVELGGGGLPGWGAAGELFDQAAGDRWGEQRFALGDGADGVGELFGADVFEEEAAGAGFHRVVDVFVHVEGCQHQHPGRLRVGDQAAGRFEPVQLGHADVHQHDVGLQLARHGQCLRSEEHTSELQSHHDLVCRLLLEKKKKKKKTKLKKKKKKKKTKTEQNQKLY